MNPIAIAALIIGGAVGLSMLARKTNAVSQWLTRYWNGQERLPDGFVLSNMVEEIHLVDSSITSFEADTAGWVRILVPPNTPVRAMADGVVSTLRRYEFMQDAGPPVPLFVIGLSHLDNGRESSTYEGLSEFNVGLGQIVRRGEVLGIVPENDRSGLHNTVPGRFGILIASVQPRRIPMAFDDDAWVTLANRGTFSRMDTALWMQQRNVGVSPQEEVIG